MLALLEGLGIKDIFYGVLITVALTWGGVTYHRYEAAVTYAKDAKAETAQVTAKAAADIKSKDDDYAATLAANKVTQDAQLKTAAVVSAALASRLRNFSANRCPNTVLPGSSAPAAGAVAGPGSAGQAGSGPGHVSVADIEADIEAVMEAATHDNVVITAERGERDSLTGK
jgi:hypothetical protein